MSRWAWVVAGVLPLVLGGCSGDPEPRFEAEPSPSVSAPATPSGSVSPAAETPEDFIRQWVAASVEMQNTGQTDAFRGLSSRCKPCTTLVDTVASYYGAGGFVRVDPVTVDSVTARPDGSWEVATTFGQTVVKKSSDSDEQVLDGGPTTYLMTLTANTSAPKMRDFVIKGSL